MARGAAAARMRRRSTTCWRAPATDEPLTARLTLFVERATAARAAARPASSGSSAGTAPPRRPAASSRSTHSSSTRRSQTASSIAACTSPSSAKRAGIVASVKSSVSTSGSSSQVTGADTVASGPRAHRVRRGDRPVARVLVVVDEDLLAALLLPPRGRHELGRAPLDLAREGERAAAHVGELPAAARSGRRRGCRGCRRSSASPT